MRTPEILAPAGSPETLSAALRAGADAVYLGGKLFSARSSAANFDNDQLREAARLCHMYGAKMYIAANTIISDGEADAFCEFIRFTSGIGVDGYIVQDPGCVYLIKKVCPDAVIHASTQMSVHTAAGAEIMQEYGFSRVVPARELDCRTLERICALPTETEVFVHGALCMSVSGQCYMSAMMGGRSANRGACGQACRLPFSADGNTSDYAALSLKDLSLLPRMSELVAIGADSLKIEGRMKRPEYVASAVHETRQALDGNFPDMKLLRGIFSRSGFTDGYFTGKRQDMFGVREKEDVTAAQTLIPKIHELYRFQKQVHDVRFSVRIAMGEPVSISAFCGDISVSISGDVPQTAQNRPTDVQAVEKQLSKLGDTVLRFCGVDCQIGEGLFVPAGVLNSMRRQIADMLTEEIISRNTPGYTITDYAPVLPENRTPGGVVTYRAVCQNREQALAALEYAQFVILPMDCDFSGIPADRVIISPPRFICDEDAVSGKLRELKERGFTRLFCHTHDCIAIGKRLGMTLHGSFTLNLFNSYCAGSLAGLGLADCAVSFEAKFSQIRSLRCPMPLGAVMYGQLPLMLTRNCPIKNQVGCGNCRKTITDRTGRNMPVACSGDYVEILNPDVLYCLDDISEAQGIDFAIMIFRRETPEQIREIFCGKKPEGRLTRGLYRRGLQEVL
ncbi:MAG: U32 family peptidase [Ruminococcus sp.]|nr:U32 family peptidase [Ruminococcus sp.]